MIHRSTECVNEFYKGKSVFITGGSGFLGKVIIEKLLYACPGIEQIYVLMRPKRNVNAYTRLKQMFDNSLFARDKGKDPKVLEKVVAITGDVALSNLGLAQTEEAILIEKVSVVIHSAATLKFNLPLREAMTTNLEGTRRVLELCKRMKAIKAFVHISTAYTNIDRCIIDECVYPTETSLGQVYKVLENEDFSERDLMGEHPNTYTFTKSLAENFIVENHGNIPVAIVRPSIVTPMIREPLTGWLDNWRGATSILAAGAEKLLWAIPGDSSLVADLIPVDYVANLSIVAAAKLPIFKHKRCVVYNCCSSARNPVTWSQVFELYSKDHTSKYLNFCPKMYITNNVIALWLIWLLMQILPAYFMDFCLLILRKKPRFVKIQCQLHDTIRMASYFTRNSWLMTTVNLRALKASLASEDIENFPFDPIDIDWVDYLPKYRKGVSKYLLNK